MFVYSGDCLQGECGIDTGHDDWMGNRLFIGDIVQLWHCSHYRDDLTEEEFNYEPCSGLTAIVRDEDGLPFVMGIKTCGFSSPEWKIIKLKDYKYVVDGENWREYGFNYRSVKK